MLECWKLASANRDGSSEGMFGPNCVTMPPPELTPVPEESATEPELFTLTPCKLTLCGPAATGRSDAAQRSAALGAPQHLLGQ